MKIKDESELVNIKRLLERPTVKELEELGYEKIKIRRRNSRISKADVKDNKIEIYLGGNELRRLEDPKKAAFGLTLHEMAHVIVKEKYGPSNLLVAHSRALRESVRLGEKDFMWGYYGQIYERDPRELKERWDYKKVKEIFSDRLDTNF